MIYAAYTTTNSSGHSANDNSRDSCPSSTLNPTEHRGWFYWILTPLNQVSILQYKERHGWAGRKEARTLLVLQGDHGNGRYQEFARVLLSFPQRTFVGTPLVVVRDRKAKGRPKASFVQAMQSMYYIHAYIYCTCEQGTPDMNKNGTYGPHI